MPEHQPHDNKSEGHHAKRLLRRRRLNALWLCTVTLIPTARTLTDFMEPSATYALSGDQSAELKLTPGSHPTRVDFRLTDPSLVERTVSALPGLTLVMIFAFTAWSIWRILSNMETAPPGQRPFTPKDHDFLGASYVVLGLGWLTYVAISALRSFVLDQHLSAWERAFSGVQGDASALLVFSAVLLGVAFLIYTKGRSAQEEMERVV